MKKHTAWIALGMTVVLCTASAAGAAVMDGSEVAVRSAELETSVSDESEAEIAETEAAKTQEQESEVSLTESESETETETAAETEKETEPETATETEKETEPETEEEEDVEKYMAVSYEDEDPWSQVAITNSEYVETGVNIRSEPSLDSEVLGYLYKGTAVWVIERGETWTEFYSNGITGYVMTRYLLFGADVQEIAEVYGAEGVRAEWDDVNIYTSDDAAIVMDTMDAGDVYQVVNDYGHWIEIQYDEDTTAYVSSEDVTSVMLFESATSKDGERVNLVKLYGATYASETSTYSEEEETYTQTLASSSDSSSSTTQTETTATVTETSASETDSSSYTDTYYEASSDSASTDSYVSSETSYQEETTDTEAETSAYTETEAETSTYVETETSAYVETEAETSAYVETEAETSAYVETEAETSAYVETEAETSAYVETEAETSAYVETEAETTYTETEAPAETESTSSGTSASTSDTTLLAALIYCEAGNQSYEGMVAVGAVVINRVNSTSFPNTISGVIYQSGQFTPASSGALARALANGVPSTCYTAAAAAIAGEDPTGGALYFNTTANKGIKIGDHWFY